MKKTQEQTSEMLRQARETLASELLSGNAPDFLERNTRILDDYFCESFEKSIVGLKMTINKNPYAFIALGGYGREEQCVHSDVDILLLFEKRVPRQAEELIQEVIYPLWDIGMDVGHATRSLGECVSLAKTDIEVLTSLLDARFICGMSFLYTKLMEQLRKKIILRRADKLIGTLIERNKERHQHFGDSAYLLEPNLKEGQGGLRDYHTLLWIARVKANVKQPRDLEYNGCLSHDEYHDLSKSLSFIWDVRNRLHHLAGRKYDRLHFEHQEKLAESLGYAEKDGQQPVEIFLGRLHGKMEFIKQQHQMFLHELANAKRQKRKNKRVIQTKISSLEVKRRMLKFASSEELLSTPELLIGIFEESARLKLPLGAEAKRVVKDFLHIADADFRTSPTVIKSFERILLAPAPKFNVLNEMLNTGFLVCFIPELEKIANRIQYDEYHLYPVDKHSLRTVQILKQFGTPDDPTKDSLCGNLYKELRNKKLLIWAALLHDIGKGESGSGGHSEKGAIIAGQILESKGYKPAQIDTVTFLVREHLSLIKTATRRDINDEETAIACARQIKDIDRLKMLYLLTVADSMSTGPKAWSDWSAMLLTGLFFNVLNILEKGELASHEAVKIVEEKKQEILGGLSGKEDNEDEALLRVMSPRYLLYTPASEIQKHIRLCHEMGDDHFVWKIRKLPDANTREVTICAKDAPGLVSKISGVFTLNNINILNVRICTWRNNIALDTFKVTPPPDPFFEDERWERAARHLEDALAGKLDLSAALDEKISDYGVSRPRTSEQPHKIVVDNDSSSFFTIIEVFTYDFPGLLFRVTETLFKCGLDVWFAKIATKVDQVVDVFYVRDFDGQKVDSPDQEAMIRSSVEKVLITEDAESDTA